MNIRAKFNNCYFKDIHSRLVENLSGQIQVKLSEQDSPNIDEYFVQEKSENIIERSILRVDTSLKVVRNKAHKAFKDKILKDYNINLNPQFDIRVLGGDYRVLYAVYEIKSKLQNNNLNTTDLYKDIQRLALVKSSFPDVKCIFILPGLYGEMKQDFETNNILLPHTFNIAGNPNFKKVGSYKGVTFKPDIVDNEFSKVLIRMKVKGIKVRLSQNLKGKRHVLFTYEILIKK